MSEKHKIIGIYLAVAVLSTAILGTAVWLRRSINEAAPAAFIDAGRGSAGTWFELTRDLEALNQAGERVRLSDLRGKVWVVAEFFAVCPQCAVRNGAELRTIYDAFRHHPDFHLVCITVDPDQDTVEKLAAYAAALGADTANWWFLTGPRGELHGYLTDELKFMAVRERSDPAEIEQFGRYLHDLGLIVVGRGWRVTGKRDLAWAREEGGAEVYARFKAELLGMIRAALGEEVSVDA